MAVAKLFPFHANAKKRSSDIMILTVQTDCCPLRLKNIYEELMKNFTKLLTHLLFFIYSSVYIVEEYVKNL